MNILEKTPEESEDLFLPLGNRLKSVPFNPTESSLFVSFAPFCPFLPVPILRILSPVLDFLDGKCLS